MLVALVFVLARNIVKLVVERRRALPFARFRAKLVTVLLGMTLIPARARADRRQRADSQQRRSLVQRADGRDAVVGQRASPATTTRSSSGWSRRRRSGWRARSRTVDLAARGSRRACAIWWRPTSLQERIDLVEVYRVGAGAGGSPQVVPVVDVAAPTLPREYSRASADRLAERDGGRRASEVRDRSSSCRTAAS